MMKSLFVLLLCAFFSCCSVFGQCACATNSNCIGGNCGNLGWAVGCVSGIFNPPNAMGQCNTYLPVSLIDFNLKQVDNHVEVTWSTGSETNNDYFVIEKSYDAEEFFNLAFISGVGNSSILTEYIYLDSFPSIGFNYYRLKQVDYDGTSRTYDVQGIFVNPENPPTIAFPNPVYQNEIYLISKEPISFVEWFDATGILVLSHPDIFLIPIHEINAGIYTLKIYHVNGSITEKRVVRFKSE